MATQYEFKSWGAWNTTYTTSKGMQRQERTRQGRQSHDEGKTWGSWNKYKETRSVQGGETVGYQATPKSIKKATVNAPTAPPQQESTFPSSIPMSEEVQANLRAGENLHITGGFKPPSAVLETIDSSKPSFQYQATHGTQTTPLEGMSLSQYQNITRQKITESERRVTTISDIIAGRTDVDPYTPVSYTHLTLPTTPYV